QRLLRPGNPLFTSPFEADPVYPPALLLELMAQLALCLLHFQAAGSPALAASAAPLAARLRRLQEARFLVDAHPGDGLTVLARLLDLAAGTAVCAGQVLRAETVCALCVLELAPFQGLPPGSPADAGQIRSLAPVKDLELERQTLQDLSDHEAQSARGGYLALTGAVCQKEP